MKKINTLAASVFAGALIAGVSLFAGAGALAQVTTTVTTPVACHFGLPSVPAGSQATLTATGGDNVNYVWSSPGLTITNPTGSIFNVAFNSPGTYAVTVTSAGQSSTCSIVVTAPLGASTGVTPGLPNTGELPI